MLESGKIAALYATTLENLTSEKMPTFVIGTAPHEPHSPYSWKSTGRDQWEGKAGTDDRIDGQSNVILGWAGLALAHGRKPFEEATYDTMSALPNRSPDQPYLLLWIESMAADPTVSGSECFARALP